MLPVATKVVTTPIGRLFLAATERGMAVVCFEESSKKWITKLGLKETSLPKASRIIDRCASRLTQYFKGNLSTLEDIPVFFSGTDFQISVWKAMRKIKPGDTSSYGELGKKVGRIKAARAVGAACRENPICIVVPCHRVVGKSGTMTGYSGGMQRKVKLLSHEGSLLT